jgi:6-phosphogluconolactonase
MRPQAIVLLASTVFLMSAGTLSPMVESRSLPPAIHKLYTMTNAAGGNEVLIYARQPGSGALTFVDSVGTGGNGTGTSLGNQGGLILTENRNYVLVVNAGSNTISSLAVSNDGLTVVDTESSGGTMPVSLTECDGIVYVLNAGGAGSISGFTLGSDGNLTAIEGSTKPLSGEPSPGPAQIGFSPDCAWLVVTEKESNLIDVYPVDQNGLAGTPVENASAGMTPFGFAFDPSGRLIVSEAFDGNTNESAVSSYVINSDGTLTVISDSIPTTETAACWVVLAKNGRYAYTTNTGSGTITGFEIGNQSGALMRLEPNGVTASAGAGSMPIDLAVSNNSRFVYVLLAGTGEIKVFEVEADGSLTEVDGGATGLAAGTNGLAVV